MAVGSGLYIAAISATVIAFVILLILQPFEERFSRRFRQHLVRVSINDTANPYRIIDKIVELGEKDIKTFSFNKSEKGYIIEINFENFDIKEVAPALEKIEKDDDVLSVYWTR